MRCTGVSLVSPILEMIHGVQLGGMEIRTNEAALVKQFLKCKIDQLQEAANKGIPTWDSPEGRANSNLAHDIWGVLRWIETLS